VTKKFEKYGPLIEIFTKIIEMIDAFLAKNVNKHKFKEKKSKSKSKSFSPLKSQAKNDDKDAA
jgi:predicted transcriptional regulator